MNTMNRRMEIINILIIRRHITTNELAQELGVSTRTIQYDIQALSPDYPSIAAQTHAPFRHGEALHTSALHHKRLIAIAVTLVYKHRIRNDIHLWNKLCGIFIHGRDQHLKLHCFPNLP